MVTGEDVFQRAIKMIDATERDGSVAESKIVSYRAKATTFITSLQGELLPASALSYDYTNLSAPLAITDKQALYVLPYGLAAELMISEDDSQIIASHFSQQYAEAKRKYPSPARMDKVKDVYKSNQERR
jgi:hypothetical protein